MRSSFGRVDPAGDRPVLCDRGLHISRTTLLSPDLDWPDVSPSPGEEARTVWRGAVHTLEVRDLDLPGHPPHRVTEPGVLFH